MFGLAYTLAADDDLYFRRLDPFGGYVGSPAFVRGGFGERFNPKAAATPWGYGLVWYDNAPPERNWYQKLDATGTPVGSPVKTDIATSFPSRLVWIGQDFLLAYDTGSSHQIRIFRFDQNGTRLGPDLRVDGDSTGAGKGNPELTWSGTKPAVAWGDTRWTGSTQVAVSLQTCCEDVPAPPLVQGLNFSDATTMAWTDNGSERYDRVRGNLGTVRDPAGDWTPSVLDCKNDRTTAQETIMPDPASCVGDCIPPSLYYLVRADSTCWAGSYDEAGGSGQQAGRDSGIESSPNACP